MNETKRLEVLQTQSSEDGERTPVRLPVSRHLKRRYLRILSLLLMFLGLTFVLAPLVGSTRIDLWRILDFDSFDSNTDAQIFWIARLPRVILGAITGATLAASGVVFQAILKNPLATPYTLGIASGASFGAVLSIRSGIIFTVLGISSVMLSAFGGAVATILLIYSLSQTNRSMPTAIMLLAGVSLSFLFAALILFVHYMSDFVQSYQILRWLMGGLDIIDYKLILNILPFVAIGLVLMLTISPDLNLISNGEELALSRGVNVSRTKRIAFFSASLTTAAVVSLSGPIGFVGLVVPHILRLLIGADNRLLMPASILAGAAFLIICDTIARTIIAPMEIPVGIITAILGSPFFIWLLLREKRKMLFKFA